MIIRNAFSKAVCLLVTLAPQNAQTMVRAVIAKRPLLVSLTLVEADAEEIHGNRSSHWRCWLHR
jgi:hypothetical protein